MIDDVLSELKGGLEKTLDVLKRELSKLRTGRAHAGMLDGIRVEYYGSTSPLSQMANVSVPEARMITVKPWDRSQVSAIEKALRESDLGLNPQSDGELIRVPVPPLSEQRRKELVKIAKKTAEEHKVGLRKTRHEALDMLAEMKSNGDVSEDEVERAKKKVEEIVAASVASVDQLLVQKEKEILTV